MRSPEPLAAVVLAAGTGSRMGSVVKPLTACIANPDTQEDLNAFCRSCLELSL